MPITTNPLDQLARNIFKMLGRLIQEKAHAQLVIVVRDGKFQFMRVDRTYLPNDLPESKKLHRGAYPRYRSSQGDHIMAKRVRHCRPCKAARTCRKRKGSPRFTAPCKARFRSCMHTTLKATGSMRAAGKKCMPELHRCSGSRTQKRAVRRYKRARAA